MTDLRKTRSARRNENRPREAAGRVRSNAATTSVVVFLEQFGVRIRVEHVVEL